MRGVGSEHYLVDIPPESEIYNDQSFVDPLEQKDRDRLPDPVLLDRRREEVMVTVPLTDVDLRRRSRRTDSVLVDTREYVLRPVSNQDDRHMGTTWSHHQSHSSDEGGCRGRRDTSR